MALPAPEAEAPAVQGIDCAISISQNKVGQLATSEKMQLMESSTGRTFKLLETDTCKLCVIQNITHAKALLLNKEDT